MMGESAPLHGLVLAGGQSRRFGQDKARFRPTSGGESLALRAFHRIRPHCIRVALSLRAEQAWEPGWPSTLLRIDDAYGDAGPLGALLSAWRVFPEAAWLVVACDLAALDGQTVQSLVAARSATSPAVAFAHPDDGKPEPLCALYEPAAQPVLLRRFEAGHRSLRGFLEAALPAASLLVPERSEALANCNTPEDLHRLRRASSRRGAPGD